MSITTTPSYQLYVGVDISARTFSAALLNPESQPEKTKDFTQTLEGYQSFQIKLLTRQPIPAKILIVMEATGTYWVTLATVLEQKGFVVSVVNPMQARNFIRSLPRQAKNDQLDAQGLARLAQALKPAGWVPPPVNETEFKEDKQGLGLSKRNKKSFEGQAVVVELTALGLLTAGGKKWFIANLGFFA